MKHKKILLFLLLFLCVGSTRAILMNLNPSTNIHIDQIYTSVVMNSADLYVYGVAIISAGYNLSYPRFIFLLRPFEHINHSAAKLNYKICRNNAPTGVFHSPNIVTSSCDLEIHNFKVTEVSLFCGSDVNDACPNRDYVEYSFEVPVDLKSDDRYYYIIFNYILKNFTFPQEDWNAMQLGFIQNNNPKAMWKKSIMLPTTTSVPKAFIEGWTPNRYNNIWAFEKYTSEDENNVYILYRDSKELEKIQKARDWNNIKIGAYLSIIPSLIVGILFLFLEHLVVLPCIEKRKKKTSTNRSKNITKD